MTAVSGLGLHVDGMGLEARAEVWLRPEVRARYIDVGCAHLSEATRGNYRSRLHRVSVAVLGPELATGRPARYRPSDPARPYRTRELSDLWSWACGQPTESLRSGLRTLIVLGAGCGLDTPEAAAVQPEDVTVYPDGYCEVRVRGSRPRRTACRRAYERELASLVQLAHPGTHLFRPHCHRRGQNVAVNFIDRASRSDQAPRLVVGKLRVTWIVTLIDERVPLSVIVAAAGVDTLHSLSRFLPFARAVDPTEARNFLRS